MQRHTTSINFHQSTLDVWMIGLTGSPIIGIHSIRVWLRYAQHPICSIYVLAYPKCHLSVIRKRDRQKQPGKIHQKKKHTTKSKNKSHKNNLDKFWLFCVFLVCFFSVCSGFVFFKPLYSLCCSAQKPGIQKGSKQTPYSNFWPERKRRVKNVWKEGGTGPPLLRIHFLNFWVRYD